MVTKTARTIAIQRQVRRLDRRLASLSQLSDRYANLRLLVVVLGVPAAAVLYFLPELRFWFWLVLVVFGGSFSGVVLLHRRVLRQINDHTIWRDIKQTHLARADLNFDRLPPGVRGHHSAHPLEIDLDLPHLHRLMNTATSRGGALRLLKWMLPTELDLVGIQRRQQRVRELTGQPLFRDKLALRARAAAEQIRESGEGQVLLNWLASEPPDTSLRRILYVLAAASATNIALFTLAAFAVIPGDLVLFTLLIYAAIFVTQFRKIQTTFEDALTIEGALQRMRAVMHFLEQDHYGSMPAVHELVLPIIENKPSAVLRRATGVISGASLRANPIFWLLVNAVIPWDYYFADRLEALKVDLNEQLPKWLDVWYEVEALSSMATFAYLNPAYTFPAISPTLETVFDAKQIGHPLIPDDERVCNDFAFNEVGEIVVITGSNMAGKSSFLRSLGVNLCLAYAGGAVCAGALAVVPFRLYTSIRVTDSLDNGISFFYAEVKRLKGLLKAIDMENEPPVLFLIDEIFRGTNNRERLIGSRSYIRALVDKNCVGLIATHDLELVALEHESPHIRNHHFREDVQEGRMVFDYILREGPSPTTNALRIMAMEGLPVEEGALPES